MLNNLTPRFGANYTPSGNWMFEWMNLNLDSVRRDMEALASIGLDHVRVLPLWPLLQPNRTLIRQDAVDDVRKVVDIIGEFGMDASVDALQGHLSSFDFLPAWLTSWHTTNMFTDPLAIKAQAELVTRLGESLVDAPNFFGLTLGNEVNQFSFDPHPSPMRANTAEVSHWMTELLAAAKAAAPNHPHVHAEYDASFYMDGHPFTPAHAAQIGDLTAIHSWIFNGTAQRYGGMSHESTHHAQYMSEVSRAFATDLDRPIWLQELGAPSNVLEPEQMPDFLESTVTNAMSIDNLWGITWWCSHDVSRKLGGFPDLEYTLGLVDANNKVKPIGQRMSEVIKEVRKTTIMPVARPDAIEIQVDEHQVPLDRSAMGPGGSIFEKWMELSKAGKNPACILSTTPDQLRQERGIINVVPVVPVGPAGGYSAVNTVVPEPESA